MALLRILLFPFAVLYNVITGLRNMLYDRGLKPSAEFDIPVINVGNLTVGGTGKTPMIEHLIRLLRDEYKIATLSRGYGRETKGFRIASDQDDASTIGDEPIQFYKKFKDKVIVSVGEDRAFAIPNILQEHEDTDVILLDDAYQHRRVKASFNVLLSDYNRPFYTDHLLPAGRLRESRSNAARAHAIVITKCPSEISDDERMNIEQSVRAYASKPVFFSTIHYGDTVAFGDPARQLQARVVLITGIANAEPFKKFIASAYTIVRHLDFADHHQYTPDDVKRLKAIANEDSSVSFITTEKDMVKLADKKLASEIKTLPLFYIPIEVKFLKSGQDFDAMILNAVLNEQKTSQII
ncbi:tetraacyldisaccharide 4'-kinase [Ohtaekwangia koreensis]|uniref:Tetraacyldisaccharide 4'-kinase n=1 Tax=Ohtaekwangia koreensis TaxID=688867 RepID=A0A1T5M231_9BACT|nr:tetraacyldisaccharide 4'-kinase [Ohtaekwangia koreensis]SKC82266.1 lipid-A-disaccharide kinase [Ohtaekwangia koreensis]